MFAAVFFGIYTQATVVARPSRAVVLGGVLLEGAQWLAFPGTALPAGQWLTPSLLPYLHAIAGLQYDILFSQVRGVGRRPARGRDSLFCRDCVTAK